MAITTDPPRHMTNGAIPRVPVEGDTTRITRTALNASGMSADELIEALAAKIATRSPPTGDGHGNGGGRKVLGVDVSSIMKWLLTAIGGAAIFVFTWYQAVNAGLRERPTTEQMDAAIGALDAKIDRRFSVVESDSRSVRESQIRIEEQAKGQAETMTQILQAIRRAR
jgi:hypothetical protein